MPLRITCPSCRSSYTVGDEMRGKRILCRECDRPMMVPAGRSGGGGGEQRFTERPARPAPARGPSRLRDDRYDDDDDDSPRSRKEQGVGLWIAAGGMFVIAVIGVTLFFILTADRTTENKPPAPGPIAQNPPVIQPVNPGGQPIANPVNPDNKVDNNPPVNPEPAKKDFTPAEPPKQPKELPAVESEVPVAALGGEKVYQRLLRSTVWILAPQKRGGGNLAGNPGQPGQGQSNLAGTQWSGSETLQGFGELRFDFKAGGQVDMHDAAGQTGGRFVHNGQNVLLSFPGNIAYTGQINGNTMSGRATNGQKNWTWTVTRQGPGAGGNPPGAPNPGMRPPGFPQPPGPGGLPLPPGPGGGIIGGLPRPPLPGDNPGGMFPPGGKSGGISTGTGSLIDSKHRLVVTNCHVVGNPESVTLYFPEHENSQLIVKRDHYKNKTGIKGRVVLQEERCDLALVQLERLPDYAKVLPLSKASVQPAQQVHSLGNPGASGGLWIYSPGRVRQVLNDKWKVFDDLENRVVNYDARKIETDSPINPGDSGGPLANDRGAMVGVAHAGNMAARSFSIFIDVSEVRTLVERFYKSAGDKWVPEPEPAAPQDVAQLPDWIKKLSDKDFTQRLKAAQVLGNMGDEARLAFGPLFLALKDDNQVVRRAVADALEKVPPHRDDVAMLAQSFKDSSEPLEVRLQAGRGLARLGPAGRSALPALFDVFKEKDESLRRQAMTTIAAVGPEAKDVPVLTEALKDANAGIRKLAADALITMGAEAKDVIPKLVSNLKKGNKEARLESLRVLQAVGSGSKEASSALAEALKDSDAAVSMAAAQALLKLGDDKTALNHFLTGIKSKSSDERRAAAAALAALGPDARPALPELVKAVDDDQARGPAIEALIKIGQDAAGPMCQKLVSAKSGRARLALIEALPRIYYDTPDIQRAVVQNLDNVAARDPVLENRQAAQSAAKKLREKTKI
jgi:HEAT repeat protein